VREKERGGALALGRAGRKKGDGPGGKKEKKVGRRKKKEKERRGKGRWAAGLGWAGGEFLLFFSNPFQTNFKPF
jgi:hypothetical protein